jgi:hypothetical protein
MGRIIIALVLVIGLAAHTFAQEPAAASTPTPQKRSLLGRVLHPFSSSAPLPQYRDPKLRGLVLDLQIAPQPVKLSEIRQLEVKVTLSNLGKSPMTLDFTTDQRIEIYLRNAAEMVLAKWSENHAVTEKVGVVVINPEEHIEYRETIATRELAPNKVYIAEAFLPKYPELRARQKFMTAP